MRLLCVVLVYLFFLIRAVNEQINNKQKIIELQKYNLVSIVGRIDDATSSKFIKDILSIKSDHINIYLSTPGGSVIAGNDIIETIDALVSSGKNITCIANEASSMGFSILQVCPTRYITANSIIMQHQMSIRLDGSLENVKNRMKLIKTLEKKQVKRQATRIGLTVEKFQKKVLNDWWMHGEDAIKENAADELVLVTCNKDLSNSTYIIKRFTIFGQVDIEYASCPLIKQPINIKFENKKHQDKSHLLKNMDNELWNHRRVTELFGYETLKYII